MTQTARQIASQELPPEAANDDREQEKKIEQPSQEIGSGKVETFQSLFGERKARLGHDGHGPEVALEKVKVESVLGASVNRVKEVEREKVEEAKGNFEKGDDDAGEQVVEEQIDKSHTQGNVLKMWSEACERFQDVYAVKGDVNMAKFGNQVDVEGGQFVIPFTRRGEMQKLLETASAGLGEAEGSFKIEHYNTLDQNTGFEAVYRYTLNGKPQEAKLTFFYFDDSQEVAEAKQKAETAKAAEASKKEEPAKAKTSVEVKEEIKNMPAAQVEDMVAQKRAERQKQKELAKAQTAQASETPAQKEEAPPVARDDEQTPTATVVQMQRNAASAAETQAPAEDSPDLAAAA